MKVTLTFMADVLMTWIFRKDDQKLTDDSAQQYNNVSSENAR